MKLFGFICKNLIFMMWLLVVVCHCRILEEQYGIHCNLTLLFSFAQVSLVRRDCVIVHPGTATIRVQRTNHHLVIGKMFVLQPQ